MTEAGTAAIHSTYHVTSTATTTGAASNAISSLANRAVTWTGTSATRSWRPPRRLQTKTAAMLTAFLMQQQHQPQHHRHQKQPCRSRPQRQKHPNRPTQPRQIVFVAMRQRHHPCRNRPKRTEIVKRRATAAKAMATATAAGRATLQRRDPQRRRSSGGGPRRQSTGAAATSTDLRRGPETKAEAARMQLVSSRSSQSTMCCWAEGVRTRTIQAI
mmetsp:Transcript_520/g.1236  ORF Transcript_520/g.1236 Transcript_520/m.1236 type:complete len:215 (+) Transcript_520:524-1168(+)